MSKTKIGSFKDIMKIEMGQSPKSEFVNISGLGVPLLNGPAEFTSRFPIPKQFTTNGNRFSEKSDILFCVRGSTTGRMNFADQEYAIGRGLAAISHKKGKEYNAFIKGLLEQNLKGLLGGSMGSVFPNLTKDQLLNYKCAIPEFETQKYIAKILSDLDAKIELNNKINAELEAMAKLIYDYWFVQFEFPFDFSSTSLNASTQGKPKENVTLSGAEGYKSSGGKMVWNEELKREVPEGWENGTLSTWIDKDKSGDWGKEEIEGNYTERVFCIRGADLNGLNGKGEVKAPERYILEKNAHKILEVGDFIVEISGGSPTQSTGRMAYITDATMNRFNAPLICSNFCKAVTLKDEQFMYNFAFEWDRAYDNGILFGYEGKTSGIKNLLFESFVTSYSTPIPPKELAVKFHSFMSPLEKKKQQNLSENQKLASLRDWLLPMLMNGQVKVGEVAEEIGMVAEGKVRYGE